jgi:hypothetical protein
MEWISVEVFDIGSVHKQFVQNCQSEIQRKKKILAMSWMIGLLFPPKSENFCACILNINLQLQV